jgi:hypothetical protein
VKIYTVTFIKNTETSGAYEESSVIYAGTSKKKALKRYKKSSKFFWFKPDVKFIQIWKNGHTKEKFLRMAYDDKEYFLNNKGYKKKK